MIKVKLHPIFKGGIERLLMCSAPGQPGKITNKRFTFVPDTEYTVEDPIVISHIKGGIGDIREKLILTPQLKSDLESYGIQYDTIRCGTCTNAKPKAAFNPFVIGE